MVIKYKGITSTISGYGVSIKLLTDALRNAGENVVLDNNLKVYDICVLHCSMNGIPMLYEEGKINVVYSMFEASRFPSSWISILNKYKIKDVIVPSTYCMESLSESGYNGNIYVVPIPIDFDRYQIVNENFSFPEIKNRDEYVFYTIMQPSERKNLKGLITAYLSEFRNSKDNVKLVIKFYGVESDAMVGRVKDIVTNINTTDNPPIVLIFDKLSEDGIISLHHKCDCYVNIHRAEGYGLPIIEALACGRPVITTGYSGNMEFCKEGKDGIFLVDYILTPVYGQIDLPLWKEIYKANEMVWAEPNILTTMKYMRYCYEKRINNINNNYIKEKYNIDIIGRQYSEVLSGIVKWNNK